MTGEVFKKEKRVGKDDSKPRFATLKTKWLFKSGKCWNSVVATCASSTVFHKGKTPLRILFCWCNAHHNFFFFAFFLLCDLHKRVSAKKKKIKKKKK